MKLVVVEDDGGIYAEIDLPAGTCKLEVEAFWSVRDPARNGCASYGVELTPDHEQS